MFLSSSPSVINRQQLFFVLSRVASGYLNLNICIFQGSSEPIFLTQFFHRLFDTIFVMLFVKLTLAKQIISFFYKTILRFCILNHVVQQMSNKYEKKILSSLYRLIFVCKFFNVFICIDIKYTHNYHKSQQA